MDRQPKFSRSELDAEIAKLEAWMPSMLASTDDGSQMDAFAGVADEIRARAAEQDQDYLWSRLQCILRESGLVPGDDEPCSTATDS